MLPLLQLLHRIKWDPEFGKGDFALGYYDRVADAERFVPLTSITMDADGRGFSVHDTEGIVAHIPFHRVRTVRKNGAVIWRRPSRVATR